MTTVVTAEVAKRVARVQARIRDAGGSLDDVTIVAVTKGFGPDAVEAAVAAGLTDVGENYAQELEAKAAAVEPGTRSRCRWHFLGHIQRNKIKRLSGLVHLWQSVDRRTAGELIAERAPRASVLVQVNVSGERVRNGCTLEEAPALVESLDRCGLDVRGVMAIGPAGPPERARPMFRQLADLADRLGLAERSMGMTDDLEVAVQEGTTMVRVGRALFGARPVAPDSRR